MRLTIRLLGLDLLDVEISTDAEADETEGVELAGGTLCSDHIEARADRSVHGIHQRARGRVSPVRLWREAVPDGEASE